MKHSKLTLSLRSLALAGAASLFFTGCLTKDEETSASYTSDGQSAYMASEVDQMGKVYDQIPGEAAGAAKSSALGLTITGELVVIPFTYDEACSCFVRKATYTGIQGYERDRVDSVTLFDAEGAIMDRFRKDLVSKIVHKRHVTRTKGAREADIHFAVTVDIKTDAGVKTGVWNGTMTGSYNGQEFKSGSLENVTRVWEDGRFRFPGSGTIELDRPVFHFLVEFLGDDEAKVTIRNKVNKKVHVLFVDADYQETGAVEQPQG